MEQTSLTQSRNSLLQTAISKLSPKVFAHPVWLRFGGKDGPASHLAVDELLNTVKLLQENEAGTACQILLICAVYQNRACQQSEALRTTQQARALSQRYHLVDETIWALWGACAISTQQGNYEQAFRSFSDLQATLSRENEWVLAGFIEVFRQFLLQGTTSRKSLLAENMEDQSFSDMLAFTVAWLHQWGLSVEPPDAEFEGFFSQPASQPGTRKVWLQFFLSIRHWRGRWRDWMVAIRGELNLQWTVHNAPPSHDLYSWRNSLPGNALDPDNDRQPAREIIQAQDAILLPAPKENASPPAEDRRKETWLPTEKSQRNRTAEQAAHVIPVAVHMLGSFNMTIGDAAVKIPASRGLSLLKYLVLNRRQYIPREVLMDTFWPDADPDLARNNLNVSLHSLRRALRAVTDLPVVVFEDGAYGLAPALQLWLDVEEFETCVKSGQRLEARSQPSAAIEAYESAVSIYRGDLLEQNPYDEWAILDRERLRIAYLDTLDRLSQIHFDQERYAACITVCQLVLARDRCREDAHCLLMRCYSRQGQHHLALRQYQMCLEALRSELQVEPAPETTHLYNRIRRREQV